MSFLPLDYHVHSHHSCDSESTLVQICRGAKSKGLSEIAFTDHLDFHPLDLCTGHYHSGAFFVELEDARADFPDLTLRAGAEVGEFHRYADRVQPILDAHPYDLVVGAMHWVDNQIVFKNSYYEERTEEQAALDYFGEILRMVQHGGFDILGHMNIVRRQGFEYYNSGFDLTPYEDAIRPVLQACIDGGIALEINTAGMRYPLGRPYPDLHILRWYREMGGELATIGSDGHCPDEVAYGFDTAREIALAAGFTRLCRFERRRVVGWVEI